VAVMRALTSSVKETFSDASACGSEKVQDFHSSSSRATAMECSGKFSPEKKSGCCFLIQVGVDWSFRVYLSGTSLMGQRSHPKWSSLPRVESLIMDKSQMFDHVLVAGCGEVTQQRVLPAMQSLSDEINFTRIGLLDVRSEQTLWPESGRPPIAAQFIQIPDGQLPLEELDRKGWLGPQTLVLNCTPTPFHVPYARTLAPFVGRVGIEKPLSHCLREATGMLQLEDCVFPIGHQLFKPEMLELTQRAARREFLVNSIGRLEFTLYESRGVGNRQVDDAVWDLGWHGSECLLAPLRAMQIPVCIRIDQTIVSTYTQGPDHPTRWTAARIDGRFETPGHTIPFVIRVGKGLGQSFKAAQVFDQDGCLLSTASLDEGGSKAHERLIRELLTQKKPNMQLGLRDVLDVVTACHDAAKTAVEYPVYRFGVLPAWFYRHGEAPPFFKLQRRTA
jgi:hypothetical protein